MEPEQDYSAWSNEQLIKRVTELEAHLKRQNASFKTRSPSPPPPPKKSKNKPPKAFDPSRYTTRLIALKFAYLGQRYNGFEHHSNNTTPLPTIEEEIWKALMKTKLIFPTRMNELKEDEVDWEGCDYSKCGRTDRGVSAFGQVIGIRVRSNRPLPKQKTPRSHEHEDIQDRSGDADCGNEAPAAELLAEPPFDPVKDELPYIQLLNRVLPEDIRMLAWCPSPPPDFSARFNCRERRYRYFFTQPAFAPVPGDRGLQATADGKSLREGWLDVEAMQDAAKRYEGLHDFRNLCKVDPSKQITNFERRIFHASIQRVDPRDGPVGYVGQPQFGNRDDELAITNGSHQQSDYGGPPVMYTFNVHGSAFLWHQVRNLVAVLFLVGQGLEPPSIVSDLLDVTKNPRRPKYEMATDAPLVLWDCVFPADLSESTVSRPDALKWIYVGDDGGRETNKKPDLDGGDGKFGRGGIMDALWEVWHKRKIDEVLAGSLLDVVAAQGRTTSIPGKALPIEQRSARVFDGGHAPRMVGKYTPILQKDRMESVEVINARYAERKGLDNKAPGSGMKAEDVNE